MNKDLIAIFEYLEREKGIKRDIVISAIEESLRAAARKSISGASNVTVTIHPKTGNIDVYSEKEIVDEVEVDALAVELGVIRIVQRLVGGAISARRPGLVGAHGQHHKTNVW